MICVDNTFLGLLLHPESRPPLNPNTGKPINRLEEKLEFLVECWEEDKETVIIPTPALSEFLILAAEDGPNLLADIHQTHHFVVKSFDEKAAVELAALQVEITRNLSKRAQKREGAEGTWNKIKFDRQIVAIAKANGASAIYSDDNGVINFAERVGLAVVKTWELAEPPPKQQSLPLEGAETKLLQVEPEKKGRKAQN